MDKEAKLESIHVPLDMMGNIEEFTSTNVGPYPLGELADQPRKITLRTQKAVQLKEPRKQSSSAQLSRQEAGVRKTVKPPRNPIVKKGAMT